MLLMHMQPENIKIPVQCHDGEEDKMEGLADPKVISITGNQPNQQIHLVLEIGSTKANRAQHTIRLRSKVIQTV